jgi:hypothetical protein
MFRRNSKFEKIVEKLVIDQLNFVLSRQDYFGKKMKDPNITKSEFLNYQKNCAAIYAENRELIEDDGSGEIGLTFAEIDI